MPSLNKLFLLLVATSLCIADAVSQVRQTARFEKESRYYEQDFIVVPMETEGLALVHEKNKFKSGKQFWEVITLDTALQEKLTVDLEIDLRNELTGYEYSAGALHLLFTRKETKGVMLLATIQLSDGTVQQYEIKPELIFVVTQFCKVGDRFAFGGYVNMDPAVLLFAPETNSLKIVPGFFTKDTDLIDMRANKNQTLNTLVLEKGETSQRKITLRTFDSSGKELLKYSVDIDDEIMLHNGICSTLELDDLVLIGTWGKKNSKQALGYYSIVVNPFGESKINRTYFGGLEHYLDYLKPKRAAKIKARTAEMLEKGKLPDFTNHVMPFKVIEKNKLFIFLSESYVPNREENHNTSFPYDPSVSSAYGGYYRSNNIYNPYYPANTTVTIDTEGKIIQGAMVAYSPQGTVLWDYSIKFDDMRKPFAQQALDYHLTDRHVNLMYKKESELRIKSFDISTGEATEFTEKISALFPGDEIRPDEKVLGEIKNWYGNTFYAWGYQTVRNRANPSKNRDVFYVNKVVMD